MEKTNGVKKPLQDNFKDDTELPAKFVIGCSDEDLGEENDEDKYHIVPPDGGWGWVVVFASFLCSMVVDGIIFTSGMLIPNLQKTYNASMSEASWIFSLIGGFYLLAGPFVSSIANAFGFRAVCIIGAILSAAACGISYFATSIYYLYVSFGILGGIGFGGIYVPAVITTGFYFEKRRALATGIAVCGSGIGQFVIAPLNAYILETYENWSIIFLIYTVICLSCIIYAIAFRPLSAATGLKKKIYDEPEVAGTPLLMRIKRARDQDLANCPSALSMTSGCSRSPSKTTIEDPSLVMNGDLKVNPSALVARTLLERHSGPPKRLSFPGVVVNSPTTIPEENESPNDHSNDQKTPFVKITAPPSSNPYENQKHLDNNKNETKAEKNGLEAPMIYPRIESAPMLRLPSISYETRRRFSQQQIAEKSRPFYRDDIFYSGSLARLPQYTSSESVAQYHASVTKIPTEVREDDKSPTKKAAISVIRKMFDFSLLKSVTFIMIGVAGFLSLFSLYVPFGFLPSYAEKLKINKSDASFLMSLIGIFNTIGRIIAGWISDHPKVDALYVNNLCLIVGGAATMVLPFLEDLSLLYLYAVIFGLCVAGFASLRAILLVELLGLEKLTNAFGLLLLFQGIAGVFGSPVAGAFVDASGNDYKVSFMVFGAIFAFSGIMCMPLRLIKKWEDDRIDAKLRQEKYGVPAA